MATKAASIVSASLWFKLGALSGATSVATGAFGAHALKNYVQDQKLLKTWETAAHYQVHLGLLVLS